MTKTTKQVGTVSISFANCCHYSEVWCGSSNGCHLSSVYRDIWLIFGGFIETSSQLYIVYPCVAFSSNTVSLAYYSSFSTGRGGVAPKDPIHFLNPIGLYWFPYILGGSQSRYHPVLWSRTNSSNSRGWCCRVDRVLHYSYNVVHPSYKLGAVSPI